MIKIHILHTGRVRVSPYLPFGGDCNIIKASGITTPQKDWIWLPVSCYLIEHKKGLILVDTGWSREMSPDGVYDKKAQITSLGSYLLYRINQGEIEKGAAIDEQLKAMGIEPKQLTHVVLTHLDCDHANGLRAVKDAQNILVSRDEYRYSRKKVPVNMIRYQKRWWEGVNLTCFDWNGTVGPAGHSYDLLGDGSITLVNIPGHCDGLCAVKVKNEDGKFVLLFSDGGYAKKSWDELITSGVAEDKQQQRKSLQWIREQSLDTNCIASIANHDPEIKPGVIEL